MIACLIACDHAEARDLRLLGSMTAAPATSVPGRHGPPSLPMRNLPGLLPNDVAGPACDRPGKCAAPPSAQAAISNEESRR